MRIFLIGFMGSGKTTIGKQLATRLGYQFIDQDEIIESRHSMTISEVFAILGESKFRDIEHDVLKELSQIDNAVISTGGGTPCFFNNMELMNQQGTTIYLKADPKTLANRLKNISDNRPLVKDKTEAELLKYVTEKLAEREPFYEKAQFSVKALNLKVENILTLIGN